MPLSWSAGPWVECCPTLRVTTSPRVSTPRASIAGVYRRDDGKGAYGCTSGCRVDAGEALEDELQIKVVSDMERLGGERWIFTRAVPGRNELHYPVHANDEAHCPEDAVWRYWDGEHFQDGHGVHVICDTTPAMPGSLARGSFTRLHAEAGTPMLALIGLNLLLVPLVIQQLVRTFCRRRRWRRPKGSSSLPTAQADASEAAPSWAMPLSMLSRRFRARNERFEDGNTSGSESQQSSTPSEPDYRSSSSHASHRDGSVASRRRHASTRHKSCANHPKRARRPSLDAGEMQQKPNGWWHSSTHPLDLPPTIDASPRGPEPLDLGLEGARRLSPFPHGPTPQEITSIGRGGDDDETIVTRQRAARIPLQLFGKSPPGHAEAASEDSRGRQDDFV